MRNGPILLSVVLLLAGCAAGPTIQSPLSPVAYPGGLSSAHLTGSATIEATYDPAPEILAQWKREGFRDDVIARHRQDVVRALVNDLAGSGLFARVLPVSANVHPDYLARIHCATSEKPTYTAIQVSLQILDGPTGRQEWLVSTEEGLGPIPGPHRPLVQVLPHAMASLKANLAAELARKARGDAEAAELAGLKKAALPDLLVSSDRDPAMARERNRALIAAKDQQLPEILRSWKTDQLTGLIVRIEQTILDLNHECEIAKDKAQQAVADGAAAGAGSDLRASRLDALAARRGRGPASPAAAGGSGVDALRDLAISYRERIELLKPIVAALKDEVANRNR